MKNNYMQDEAITAALDIKQIRRLASYLGPYKKQVIQTIVFMFSATLTELIGPYLLSIALDIYIPQGNFIWLAITASLYLVSLILSYVFSRRKTELASQTGQKVIYDIRTDLFERIQSLSFKFFDNISAGKIIVRVVNDVNSLNDLFTNGIINVISECTILVVAVVFMFLLNFKLALITFLTVPPFMLGIFLIQNKIKRKWMNVRIKISNLNSYIHESISGMRVIQAYVRQSVNRKIFHGVIKEVFFSWMDAIRINSLFGPTVQVVSVLGTVLIYWYGSKLMEQNYVTIGILIAFTTYLKHFWRPVITLSNFYNQLLIAMASSERIFELMDQKPDIVDLPDAVSLSKVKGEVSFENVRFGYERQKTVLKNINLKVKPGENIAFVGQTGSGKTTLINMVARFYDPTVGRVLIDGYDIRHVTLDSLRKTVGIMLQEPFIFSGTVLENIKYGNPNASFEEVVQAAKAVNAHEFIVKMEEGYNTELHERGSRLSIGQRQLIAFARVLLADPDILILDEATASVDTHTEILLQKAVEKVLKNRTSFIIAHRLSTIRNAHRIAFIKDGEILEIGSHEELMKKKGYYYELYEVQYKALKAV